MKSAPVYIVGAGLSGLSAAVALAAAGVRAEIIEAAGFAGGRCRSYYDAALGQTIDNGNHLILSGNAAVQDYLRTIGTQENFLSSKKAEYAFVDVGTDERWTLKPNDGSVPWWTLDPKRRVPGTRAIDYLAIAKLIRHGRDGTALAQPACSAALWQKLVHPLLLAALNTEPETASAALVATILRETLAKGGRACRPRIASPTLGAAFVDPAIAFVRERGGAVRFGQRLRGLKFDGSAVKELELADAKLPVPEKGSVILAVPPWAAQSLVPDIAVPDAFHGIVSGHFKIAPPTGTAPITGVIGGTSEWIFAFPDRISVTISNADRLIEKDREELAVLCWRDVAKVCCLPADMPAWQIVKERRATFAATPEQQRKRPAATTRWANFFLAGDWTDTGLPATIEGAVRSGQRAAKLALARMVA